MYLYLQRRLGDHMAEFLLRTYGLGQDIFAVEFVVEQPPRIELGDYAFPLAFGLAKRLRKSPLKIAQEIVDGIGPVEGFEKLEVAGAGYINAHVDRAEFAAALVKDTLPKPKVPQPKLPVRPLGKVLVEHSSINPNKAAHIGHLRNAILGDTFVRLLRFAGREVDVQNYIDNTGVQVADVVVGLVYIKKRATLAQVKEYLARRHIGEKQYAGADPATDELADVLLDLDPSEEEVKTEDLPPDPVPIDHEMWKLYARVSGWYDAPGEEEKRKLLRSQVLHAIEKGDNELAEIADFVSTEILKRHLETMERLDIQYDFLPRESEILHLHFWDAAFTKLKEAGVLRREDWGKNAGCWVMARPGRVYVSQSQSGRGVTTVAEKIEIDPRELIVEVYTLHGREGVRLTHVPTKTMASCDHYESQDENEQKARASLEFELSERQSQKVIVRSNGTVGYVGKDIAYHMWKFGLLGRDFGYRKFFRYPNAHDCWISAMEGEKEHPHFGDVAEIYNVIDARQSEAQNTVIEALRGLGHDEAADRYTHFSYEMVALTPRCATELGYELSEEDRARPWIEVSGRKGFGVKADDLLDALIASAGKEVDARHPELSEAERASIAAQIAIGALRYFMLKFTKPSVIAFDFKDALSFEGDTGPYAQYAVVRASNIFRKGGLDPENFSRDAAGRFSLSPDSAGASRDEASLVSTEGFAKHLTGESANDIWELWLAAAKTSYIVSQCIAATEPAYLAKHAFQLAQLFSTFYHRYPILSEADEGRRKFLLATVAVVRRELIRVLAAMGIGVPPVM